MSLPLIKKSWKRYFFGTQADSPYGVFLNIHLYDLLDVLDLVDELHLCHPLVVLEPADCPET